MKASGWLCGFCKVELLLYDIGFDDGAQCPRCKAIYELYELTDWHGRLKPRDGWKPPTRKEES